jgi:FtsH-binding integral membrane protein
MLRGSLPPAVAELFLVRRMDNAHRRILSSPYTVVWKFIFPAIWISGFGAGAIAVCTSATDANRWIFPTVWIVASAWLLWFALRLRRVAISSDTLYISTYRREISLPLSSIVRVTQSYMSRPQTITLHTDRDTLLGRKFLFVAPGWPRIISRHPLAIELDELIAQHRSPSHANA